MKLCGEGQSQCCLCGKYFTSTRAFDRHQIDQFDNPRRPVRCMTSADMEAKGFAKTAKGFLREPTRPRKADRQTPTKNDGLASFAVAA